MTLSPTFRHLMGFSSARPHTLLLHPDGQRVIYPAGRTVVISGLADPENQVLLRGHVDAVTALALDPAGRFLLSAETGQDSDVCIWDLQDEQLVHRFAEHDFGVSSVSYSQDGLFYCSHGSHDAFIFICEAASNDIVAKRIVDGFTFSRILFGGRICDARGRKLAKYSLLGLAETGELVSIVFDPKDASLTPSLIATGNLKKVCRSFGFCYRDTSLAVAGTAAGEVIVVDAVRNVLLTSVRVATGSLGSAGGAGTSAMSGGSNSGAPAAPGSSSIDCVAVIPPDPAAAPAQMPVYTTYERLEAFDEKVAAGGHNFVAILKGQGDSWQLLHTIPVAGDVTNLYPDAQGRILCGTAGGNITLLVPDASSGCGYSSVPISENHTDVCTGMHFVGTGEAGGERDMLVTCSRDRTARVWDLHDYFPGLTVFTSPRIPTAVTVNDIQLVVGSSEGDVACYDIETGDRLLMLEGADRVLVNVLSAGKGRIITGGENGDVRTWDIRTRKIVSGSKEHVLRVTSVNAAPDGTVVSSSEDKFIIATLDGVRSGEVMCDAPVRGMVMWGGLCYAACGHTVQVISVPKRAVLNKVEARPKFTSICANSRAIFAGGEDGVIYVYGHDLSLITRLAGHASNAAVIRLACTEAWLASADIDGCVLLWSM